MSRSPFSDVVLTALLFTVCCCPAFAQGGGVGEVSFANSGAPAAQADFLRGLALLHSFEYGDAAGAFRRAQADDPGFAMAYWGEAMTYNHPLWAQQDAAGARAVLQRLAPTPEERLAKAKTAREKAYLHAVEVLYGDGDKYQRDDKYSAAMAEVHRDYPGDVDATAFYALSILGTAHTRDVAKYMRAAALLEEVFPTHQHHPGVVHYLIHCYDDPVHAPLGLRAARIYAQLAPDAAHAQHMTSHIFIALGMWDDVVRANENAVAVSERNVKGHYPRCSHYPFWLEYGYLQQGRVQKAREVLEACRADASPQYGGSYSQMRNRYLLDTQRWDDEVVRWPLPPSSGAEERVTCLFGTGYAAAQRGDSASARDVLAQLHSATAEISDGQESKRAQILEQELTALLESKTGHPDDAIARLRRASEMDHAMPFEFGPPFVDKPVDELLGEVLLAANQPGEAEKAFDSALARAPGRVLSLRGLEASARLAGDHEAAATAAQQLAQALRSAETGRSK